MGLQDHGHLHEAVLRPVWIVGMGPTPPTQQDQQPGARKDLAGAVRGVQQALAGQVCARRHAGCCRSPGGLVEAAGRLTSGEATFAPFTMTGRILWSVFGFAREYPPVDHAGLVPRRSRLW